MRIGSCNRDVSTRSMTLGEFQRLSRRTGPDDRATPSDEPFEAPAWQMKYRTRTPGPGFPGGDLTERARASLVHEHPPGSVIGLLNVSQPRLTPGREAVETSPSSARSIAARSRPDGSLWWVSTRRSTSVTPQGAPVGRQGTSSRSGMSSRHRQAVASPDLGGIPIRSTETR